MPGFIDNITGALRSIGQPQTNFDQVGGYSPANYTSPYARLDAALGNPLIASAADTPPPGVLDPTFMQSCLDTPRMVSSNKVGAALPWALPVRWVIPGWV